MSVRLFHKGSRLVWRRRPIRGEEVWYALHRSSVPWLGILAPALTLVGFQPEPIADGVRFGGGTVRWTRGALGSTIRLTLPPCSERKAALLAAGLLKAARYAPAPGASDAA